MTYNCWNCGHRSDGSISYDELGWHSSCEKCGVSFDVDVPEGRYRVLISGDNGKEYEEYWAFEDYQSMCGELYDLIGWWEGYWIWVYDGDDIILEGVFDYPCIDEIYTYCKEESKNA